MNIKQKRTLAIIVGLVVGISIGGGYYANKLSTDPTLGAPTKIDISTQTNLEATSPVVLTNDTLSINLASSALEIDSTASISGAITLGNLISCDTIDSDANGLLSCGTDDSGGGTGMLAHGLLSDEWHNDVSNASASAGALIYGSGTTWTPLAVGASDSFLLSDGTNPIYLADPTVASMSITNLWTSTLTGTLTGDLTCTDCLNATEIEDIYFLTAGDNASASVMTIDSADITSASFGTIYAGTWNGAKIDVSDYTNFTAGTGFDLDGDTLNADFSEFTLDTSLLGGDMIPFWEDTGGDEKKISWTNMQASIDALGTITIVGASVSGEFDIVGDLNVPSASFTNIWATGTITGNLTGAVTGNASTATALAANGANCPANQYPLGVDQYGAVESCTADAGTTYTATNPLSLVGTAFSIDLASAGGDGYLSGTDWGNFNTAYGWGDWSGEGFITAADVPANETDSAHDTCGEVTGCVVGAITASASVLTVSVEANIVSLSADTYWGAGLADCDNATTSKLLYSDTGKFSCGTDNAGAGAIDTAVDPLWITGSTIDIDLASAGYGGYLSGADYDTFAAKLGASFTRASASDSLTVGDILHAGILTDGTATLTGGSLTGLTDITSTLGTFTHASISDDLTIGEGGAANSVINFYSGADRIWTFGLDSADNNIKLSRSSDFSEENIFTFASLSSGFGMYASSGLEITGLFETIHASVSDDLTLGGVIALRTGGTLTDTQICVADGTAGAIDCNIAQTYYVADGCSDCLNATEIEDIYLLDDGDVGTGVYDFGGATSFELPNAADPTVNVAGQIAIDTTAGQLTWFNGQQYTTIATESFTFNISSGSFDVTNPTGGKKFLEPITITSINCVTKSATSIKMQIVECDGNGANCVATDSATEISCSTTNAADDGALSNPSIDAGDWVMASLSQASGEVDWVYITVEYFWTEL